MSTSVDVSLLKRAAEDAANYSRSDDRLPTKESELANNIRSGFLSIRNTVDIKPFASDLADPMKFVLDPKLNDVSLNIHTWLNIVLRQLETLRMSEPSAIHVRIAFADSQESWYGRAWKCLRLFTNAFRGNSRRNRWIVESNGCCSQ